MKLNRLVSLIDAAREALSLEDPHAQEEICASLTPFCPEIVELLKLKTHATKSVPDRKGHYGFDEHEVWV